MIDWTRVESLRNDVGSEDFDEVVALFLEEVDEVIARLRGAPDPSKLASDLHFLKGSAMGLGFAAFSDQCQSAETLCGQGHVPEVDLATILSCYDASRQEFLRDMEGALQTSL